MWLAALTLTPHLPFLLGLSHSFMHTLPIKLHRIIGDYMSIDGAFGINIKPHAYIPHQCKHTEEESLDLLAIRQTGRGHILCGAIGLVFAFRIIGVKTHSGQCEGRNCIEVDEVARYASTH